MRTLLACFVLLAAAPLVAQAQRAPATFSFGLKGGASLSNLTSRQYEDGRYLWGFHAGATGQVAFSPRLALQVEALYSQKGDGYAGSDGKTTTQLRLHYLDVPVLARLRAGHFFAEAGPQLGLLLASRGLVVSFDSGIAYGSVTNFLNRVELGYVGGLGYQLPHGFGLGLRYNGGLRRVLNSNTYGVTQHNSAFQLYASYQFGK